MVSIPLWFDSYGKPNKGTFQRELEGLNSIMVRFIRKETFLKCFATGSQFHYGSIHNY